MKGEKLSFQAFHEIWLRDYAEQNLDSTTIATYKRLLSAHILPVIGLKHIHNIISVIYSTAMKWNIVLDNPCDLVDKHDNGYTPSCIERNGRESSRCTRPIIKQKNINVNQMLTKALKKHLDYSKCFS